MGKQQQHSLIKDIWTKKNGNDERKENNNLSQICSISDVLRNAEYKKCVHVAFCYKKQSCRKKRSLIEEVIFLQIHNLSLLFGQ